MKSFVVALALLAAAPLPAAAVEFAFATPEQGAAVLTQRDDFMAAVTPLDLAIRLQRNDDLSVDALADLYAANTLDWSPEERARLQASIERVAPRLALYQHLLPARMLLIKSTRRVDAGFAFTRGDDIVMGAGLPDDDARLDSLLAHEVFHVLSRRNADRRDAIYAAIGFVRCAAVTLPAEIEARRFTNPDAPVIAHVFPLGEGDVGAVSTPVLVSNRAAFDPTEPDMPRYIGVELPTLQRDAAGTCAPAATAVSREETMAALRRRTGGNTNYILHAEEIAADNFAQMVTGRADAPDPQVYVRLAAALAP